MAEGIAHLRRLHGHGWIGRGADARRAGGDSSVVDAGDVIGLDVEVHRRAADFDRTDDRLVVRMLVGDEDRRRTDPQLGMPDPPRATGHPRHLLRPEDLAVPVDGGRRAINDQVGRDRADPHASAKSTMSGAWSEGMPGYVEGLRASRSRSAAMARAASG